MPRVGWFGWGAVAANWRCIGNRFFDFVPDENGRFVFRAGAVYFPSSWRPEEKIGLAVHTIHSPVPTLNENLGVRIDKFLANLEPGKAWQRSNWGLSRSPELNQHIPRATSRASRRRSLTARHGDSH